MTKITVFSIYFKKYCQRPKYQLNFGAMIVVSAMIKDNISGRNTNFIAQCPVINYQIKTKLFNFLRDTNNEGLKIIKQNFTL